MWVYPCTSHLPSGHPGCMRPENWQFVQVELIPIGIAAQYSDKAFPNNWWMQHWGRSYTYDKARYKTILSFWCAHCHPSPEKLENLLLERHRISYSYPRRPRCRLSPISVFFRFLKGASWKVTMVDCIFHINCASSKVHKAYKQNILEKTWKTLTKTISKNWFPVNILRPSSTNLFELDNMCWSKMPSCTSAFSIRPSQLSGSGSPIYNDLGL